MRALVMGGTGFIGRHLVSALLASGNTVKIIGRTQPQPGLVRTWARYNRAYEFLSLDFSILKEFDSVLGDIDAIYVLASSTLPRSSNDNPDSDIALNLIPMIRLLEACRHFPNIKIIYASSGGTIYGKQMPFAISETAATNPICSYGIVKLTIEKYLGLYEHLYGLKYAALRISNPYGLGQNPSKPQGAIGVFLTRALHGEPITIWGDGSIVRDYVAVADVIDAFLKARQYHGPYRIFNVGSGIGTSIRQILDWLPLITGKSIDVRYEPQRNLDVPYNVLNTTRAQSELGWQPNTALETGLRTLFKEMQTPPDQSFVERRRSAI